MKKGFTLSEILIVMVVIGVIVAIVVPSLCAKANAASIKKTLQKGFSVLANAYSIEFAVKPLPKTKDDGEKVIDALRNNTQIKSYLTCEGGVCSQKYEVQPVGSWIITDDNIAYKVIQGGAENCATKQTITQIRNTNDAIQATCLAVVIDSGCVSKHMNEKNCVAIQDGTQELAKKTKTNNFIGEQMVVFVSNSGITTGNPDYTASGVITSEE